MTPNELRGEGGDAVKVAITEDDVRAALPEFFPVCTPRLMEEAVRAVRIVALERAWEEASDQALRLQKGCVSALVASDGLQAYYDARRRADAAEKRASKLWDALQAEREGRA